MKEKYQKLIKNLHFYHNNLAQFEREYQGKYLLIWEQMVAGIYQTYEEGMAEAGYKFDPGTYLLKQCQPIAVSQVTESKGIFHSVKNLNAA